MYPYISLDVTQSGVLKSDTGEERERGSLAAINTDNCHSLVRRDHQIWVWIVGRDNVITSVLLAI